MATDGWQALYNWTAFGVVVSGLVYYYIPKDTKSIVKQPVPAKDPKRETKKPVRKPDQQKAAPPAPLLDDQSKGAVPVEKGNQKRKTIEQSSGPSPAIQEDEEDVIDMSTRQFAASMQKAREGVKVKASNANEARIRTVKPRDSPAQTPVLSSGSSQAGDVEDDWSSVPTKAPGANGVEDMLEPAAPGPTSLRITAPERPTKEKLPKQAKKEVVETKKQRQNRQKAEQRRLERHEQEAEQKVKKEQQMRLARESRGEPARNGIPIAAAPAQSPWKHSSSREASAVVSNTGSSSQLLDTLDTESNSSSNQGDSTAATSTTDAGDGQLNDFTEGDLAKAIEESERDSGWSEVRSSKKLKKKASNNAQNSNGDHTPVAQKAASGQPNSYSALPDELENGDSVWTA